MTDQEANAKYHKKHRQGYCPSCRAKSMFLEIRDYIDIWKDAHLWCTNCDTYLGTVDIK